MTVHDGNMAASIAATPDSGPMRYFADIGTLLLAHSLPPVPDVYDLLWRYVRDEDHDLSLTVDRAVADGRFNLSVISELRRSHGCDRDSDIAASEIAALLAAAHDQAEALSQRIEIGRIDLADYGRAIADSGARLETPIDAAGLAILLGQLSTATATIQAANARLEGELAVAAAEASCLSEKLSAAERAAITDPLTGVLNRRGTIEMLERLQAEARTAGTELALAMIDIDHFKRVNDRFGHALGDDVLRFVARHLADRLALVGGQVGRFGGEEFIAVLPDHDVMRATAAIDTARAQLASQIIRNAFDGSSMGRVSFSAGVSGDRDDDSCDTLIGRADRAMYNAKRMGRDRVVPDR